MFSKLVSLRTQPLQISLRQLYNFLTGRLPRFSALFDHYSEVTLHISVLVRHDNMRIFFPIHACLLLAHSGLVFCLSDCPSRFTRLLRKALHPWVECRQCLFYHQCDLIELQSVFFLLMQVIRENLLLLPFHSCFDAFYLLINWSPTADYVHQFLQEAFTTRIGVASLGTFRGFNLLVWTCSLLPNHCQDLLRSQNVLRCVKDTHYALLVLIEYCVHSQGHNLIEILHE